MDMAKKQKVSEEQARKNGRKARKDHFGRAKQITLTIVISGDILPMQTFAKVQLEGRKADAVTVS
ncbi:MAG: hypothetical protein IJ865_04670, partial [Clostridia bacterium]|nr:hypothetical protein [Clostridia bacterium]